MMLSKKLKRKQKWKKIFLFSLGALFGMWLARKDYDKKVEDVVELYAKEICDEEPVVE